MRLLSCMIRSVAVLSLLFGATDRAVAESAFPGLLNPQDFPLSDSGAFPTAAGTYTINTSGTPTLSGPGGTSLTGVVSNGVAVFDFNTITVGSNQTFVGSGSLPVALLSLSRITVDGTIDVSGTGSIPGTGGGAGGRPIGPGNMVGLGGGPGGSGINSGGSFGGVGGQGTGPFPPGPTYGNLLRTLQGGSGGGGEPALPGGGGGGAVELSALGRISIDAGGNILANGGVGSFSPRGAGNSGGGGSGGGILIHSAESVVLSGGGLLSANGGDGGSGSGGPGGGGGGGRVTIALEPGALFSNLGGTINVAGGAGGVFAQPNGPSGGGGSPGVFSVAAVPEPAGLVMAGTALLGGLGYTGLRRWAST